MGAIAKKAIGISASRSRNGNCENIDREGQSRITPPHQNSTDQKQKANCQDFNNDELENFAATSQQT